ncbi:RNA polymerase sigma-54 factor [Roseobacter sp. YSTF-M11]|uniref:RNA polymerase sigma-54 factor n=1 Tax=Roseobacter insulae TaxID=2859783 RepID=A0A9X1K0D3_9RHOB|nr:RNA polymerase sigma-54 factor [Roseobacter insulae]MBW4710431.1 RNA polymerase sigma-54 factor [Roseobacter insulae]
MRDQRAGITAALGPVGCRITARRVEMQRFLSYSDPETGPRQTQGGVLWQSPWWQSGSAMHLKPKLQTRQTQKLSMTPSLRQAIGLLSLSNGDVTRKLWRAARTNPCIGIRPPHTDRGIENHAAPESLVAHVTRQIGASFRQARTRRIAMALLDALEPWGWLGQPLTQVAQVSGSELAEVEAVLTRMQGFEPTGIFARSLAECLRLQAAENGQLDRLMMQVLSHLELVAKGDWTRLAEACGGTEAAIVDRVGALRGLDPKPGLQFGAGPVTPPGAADLLVMLQNGIWTVVLNPASLPEITTLPGIDAQARREADRLNTALERRNATILAVATELVSRQAAYLDGADAPAPLTQVTLAASVGRHPSTVGRVMGVLTAQTPRGHMPLRGLMGRSVRGTGLGVDELQHRIARLIAEEDPANPLSDARLAGQLCAAGITIDRRTVAKYRASQGAPPAAARRRVGPKTPT